MASELVPKSPLTETMNKENCRRWLIQASKYLRFFSLSAVSRFFSGVFITYDAVYVLITCMYKMKSVFFTHTSWIRRQPLCYESSDTPGRLLGGWDLSCGAFTFYTAWTRFMRGLSRTCVAVRDLLVRSATLSHISLCRYVIRRPFLKYNAWNKKKLTPSPYNCWGRSVGLMPHPRNTSSLY